jgi:hypothetical protein
VNLAVPDQVEIEDAFLTCIFQDFLHSSLNGLLFSFYGKPRSRRKRISSGVTGAGVFAYSALE